MSLVLDTNICSAYLKNKPGILHRFVQYGGRLYIPSIVLGELLAGAIKENSQQRLEVIQKFSDQLTVLNFDRKCAEKFGEIRGVQLRTGRKTKILDFMIACIALAHDFTLVTNNTKDFEDIPGLRIEDWLA